MGYECMTVLLDNTASFSRTIAFSIDLAARHGAHLTGLYLSYEPVIVADPYGLAIPVMQEWDETAQAREDHARNAFYLAADKAGIHFSWVVYRGTEWQKAISHARASDLVIVCQRNPADSPNVLDHGVLKKVILKLGKPVLMLPYDGTVSLNFAHIIMAWDGGREAARAMTDALPYLKLAEIVKVVTISDSADLGNDLPDVDIAAYLAKHDVKVEIERNQSVHLPTADWLLDRAGETGAGLLVMGAYGHHRLTELVLGGVTHTIMRKMTLPVLMSH